VSTDDLLKFGIGAIILVVALVRTVARAAKRGSRSAAPRTAAPSGTAPPSGAQQRVAAMLAEMQRRGIAPPPSLQAIATMEGVPVPGPPPPQQQRQARTDRTPDPARRAPPEVRPRVFPAPGTLAPAAPPPAGSTRRMVIEAFSDPEHARNAVILAEILGSPVALRSTTSRPWAAL
jgi:hypothetical protein